MDSNKTHSTLNNIFKVQYVIVNPILVNYSRKCQKMHDWVAAAIMTASISYAAHRVSLIKIHQTLYF